MFSWESFQESELAELVISSAASKTDALLGLMSGEPYVLGGVWGRSANWPTRRGFQDSRVAVIEHWLCVGRSLGPYMPVSLLVTVTTGRKVLPCSDGT